MPIYEPLAADAVETMPSTPQHPLRHNKLAEALNYLRTLLGTGIEAAIAPNGDVAGKFGELDDSIAAIVAALDAIDAGSGQNEQLVQVDASGATVLDPDDGRVFNVTLSADADISISDPSDATRSIEVRLIQNNVGGHVPTFSGVRWSFATEPSFPTAADDLSVVALSWFAPGVWLGFVGGESMGVPA